MRKVADFSFQRWGIMYRTFTLVLGLCLVALSAACSSSGTPEPACVPNESCVPPTGANACTIYQTACDATSGATLCVASPQNTDGESCATGKVCLANSCIDACVPGVTCTPTSTPVPCKSYATACSAKLTATSCAVSGNQPDGTECGSALVCSSGACAASCVAGVACTPTGSRDPCKAYATTCTSTLAQEVCAPVANLPAGTTCNGTSACQADGTCLGALAPPVLSPPGGTGVPGLTVTITGPSPSALVYYTTDGTAPSDLPATRSATFLGSGTVVLQSTAVVQAFATLGEQKSATVVGVYTITPIPPPPVPPPVGVLLGSGFTSGSVQTNGAAAIVGTRLQLTPSARYNVATAFYPQALNVQTFTTDFSFQITDPVADGMTFTIQGNGAYAIGSQGGGLGYGPDPFDSGKVLSIGRSVAIKFDIFDNDGEGYNSTGIFTDGAAPTVPALDMTSSGVILRSGHVLDVNIVYDGSILALTITDKATTPVSVFSATFPIDIPAHVGDVTGYVGFTAATGELTGSHQVINWTYSNTR